jgi:hypothetical protein
MNDNSDVVWFWVILVVLFAFGTLVWNFGWIVIGLAALALVAVVTVVGLIVYIVSLYPGSELHFRINHRKFKRQLRALKKLARKL